MFATKYAFLLFLLLVVPIFGCETTADNSYQENIDLVVDRLQTNNDFDTIVTQALNRAAISYKPEATYYLKRFLLASEDIAKGNNQSVLITKFNYPVHLRLNPEMPQPTDDVAIILDAGFSDVALTYAKDIIASFEVAPDGSLHEKTLELTLPRWAWYLYEKQAEAGTPFRVLGEAQKIGFRVLYPSNNLIRNTDYLEQLKAFNGPGFPNNTIVYDRQMQDETAYHGAKLVYTLKEWAPSTKLILVRYNFDAKSINAAEELRLLKNLDVIAKKYHASVLIRSSIRDYHWTGFDKNAAGPLEDVLIITSSPDGDYFAKKFAFMKTVARRSNFILANSFSSASSGLQMDFNGKTLTEIRAYLDKISPYSFPDGKLTKDLLDVSTVFVDRHVPYHQMNHQMDRNYIKGAPFFSIGFGNPAFVDVPCSVEPHFLAGDTSSAAPLVAAWAIYIKNRPTRHVMDNITASIIKNTIAGYRYQEFQELSVFQDPLGLAMMPIFQEGYGNGLIIPKKFSDY